MTDPLRAYRPEDLPEAGVPARQAHWILPGALPIASKILVVGDRSATGAGLVIEDLAVSVATFTPFLGAVQPWAAGRVLCLAGDAWGTGGRVSRLLAGRGIPATPPELRIVPAGPLLDHPADQDALKLLIDEYRPTLMIVEPFHTFVSGEGGWQLSVRLLFDRLVGSGVGVVLGIDPAVEHVATNLAFWSAWAHVGLVVSFDTGAGQMFVRAGGLDSRPLVRTIPQIAGDRIEWDTSPQTGLRPLEAKIYRIVRQEPLTVNGLRTRTGSHHNSVVTALQTLLRKRLVRRDIRPVMTRRGVQTQTLWTGIDPYLDIRLTGPRET